jgi:hypothetical protein
VTTDQDAGQRSVHAHGQADRSRGKSGSRIGRLLRGGSVRPSDAAPALRTNLRKASL